MKYSDELCGRRFCSLCGEEIGIGEAYWIINGAVVCGACLPAYARQDYLPCRLIRGKEGERL